MKKFLALTAVVVVSAISSYADTLATWTFETTSAGIAGTSNHIDNIAADVGSGFASGVHASASTTWSSPAGNGSAHSFSDNNWAVGDYAQFQLSTVGFTGLSLSYDQVSSGTGPRDFTLSYSLDGSSFTQIGSMYSVLANAAPNPLWNTTTSSSLYTFNYDLGSLVDNSANVYFRITDASTTAANGTTVAATGTDRIDNFSVFTTPIPEPSSVALGILGGLAGLIIMKRRK
jgi:hypothetical protein